MSVNPMRRLDRTSPPMMLTFLGCETGEQRPWIIVGRNRTRPARGLSPQEIGDQPARSLRSVLVARIVSTVSGGRISDPSGAARQQRCRPAFPRRATGDQFEARQPTKPCPCGRIQRLTREAEPQEMRRSNGRSNRSRRKPGVAMARGRPTCPRQRRCVEGPLAVQDRDLEDQANGAVFVARGERQCNCALTRRGVAQPERPPREARRLTLRRQRRNAISGDPSRSREPNRRAAPLCLQQRVGSAAYGDVGELPMGLGAFW